VSNNENKLGLNDKENPANQLLTPAATGLTHYQLNMLKGLMKKARKTFNEQKFDLSQNLCRRCIDIYPSFAAPLAVLGNIAIHYQDFELAIEFYEKSLSIIPNVPRRLFNCGAAFLEINEYEDALTAFDKCLSIAPNFIFASCSRAVVLNILGHRNDAISVYLNLMEIAPLYGRPFHQLSTLVKFEEDGKYNKYFVKLAQEFGEMKSKRDLVNAHFALGKYYEDLKDFKLGFQHFQNANTMLASDVEYSLDEDISSLEENKIKFPKNGHWLRQFTGGSKTDIPLFIVGMPRSGTTLTEQILANHSKIFGAGELSLLAKYKEGFPKLTKETNEIFPTDSGCIEQFENYIDQVGQELFEIFSSKSPTSRYVIDKMPHNFVNLGYKQLFLPNAKIIHCKRNPIDTCLSSFRLQFNGKLEFTTDLVNLGKYYVAYSSLMDHWNEVFPGQILEVQYEDVVNDVETQTRRMIDFIGLEWEDSCLQFYSSKRSVHTASVSQVRQPIYSSSIGQYERYGDLLNPLIEELKPVLDLPIKC